MKAFIFTAAAVTATATALLTAPAFAQVPAGSLGAIAHFNGDKSGNEIVRVVEGSASGLSSRTGVVEATERFNSDRTGNELRKVSGQTLISGEPAYGAEIFARIREENRDED